jgi:hypothetical protein
MKRFLMLVGVAVVAAAMYVAAGTASQQSGVSPKAFKALQKQVATLSKTLKTVKAEAADADGFIQACLVSSNSGVLPINDFGDPGGTFGYQFLQSDGVTKIDTTALDVDLSTPFQGVYLQGVDPACVSAAARHNQTRSGAGHLHFSLRGESTR